MEQHPFLKWLGEIEKGKVVDDALKELREVVKATANTRKPSTLVLSFAISRYDLDDDEDTRRDVQVSISTRKHVPKRGHTTMYVTEDMGLQRYDPRQMRFLMPQSEKPEQPQHEAVQVPVHQQEEQQ